jgi:hypothetical protein
MPWEGTKHKCEDNTQMDIEESNVPENGLTSADIG